MTLTATNMKKILQIFLMFALIAGVVVAALLLSGGGSTVDVDIDNHGPMSKLQAEIEDSWKNSKAWDKELYDVNHTKIDMYANQKMLKVNEAEVLKESNQNSALELIDSILMKEYGKSACNNTVVTANYEGIKYLGDAGCTHADIAKHRSYYSTYTKIRSFIRRSAYLDVVYDTENGTWNSFDRHAASFISERDSYLNSSNYKSVLSGISELKNGLAGVDEKVKTQRQKFYSTLLNEIISHHQTLTRADENLSSLIRIQESFNREAGDYSVLRAKMNDFVRVFIMENRRYNESLNNRW